MQFFIPDEKCYLYPWKTPSEGVLKPVTMIDQEVRRFLIPQLFNAAVKAGAAIMSVYAHKEDYDVAIRSDHTPITEADRLAHKTIRDALGTTRIPILSEEGREMRYEERQNWELYWLVDPLDGTLEFIKGNNEFTVNIALMEDRVCVCSVVYVPYFEKMYLAGRGRGAFLKEGVAVDADAAYTYEEICSGLRALPFAGNEGVVASSASGDSGTCDSDADPASGACGRGLRVGLSRSHKNAETMAFIDRVRERYPDLEVVEQGSSYKFCLLAEGTIDYYPRATATYEWDTAAGELILSEAGGRTDILSADGEPQGKLRYNEEDLHNPWFVARSKFCPF